jgi:hypothetical protein
LAGRFSKEEAPSSQKISRSSPRKRGFDKYDWEIVMAIGVSVTQVFGWLSAARYPLYLIEKISRNLMVKRNNLTLILDAICLLACNRRKNLMRICDNHQKPITLFFYGGLFIIVMFVDMPSPTHHFAFLSFSRQLSRHTNS